MNKWVNIIQNLFFRYSEKVLETLLTFNCWVSLFKKCLYISCLFDTCETMGQEMWRHFLNRDMSETVGEIREISPIGDTGSNNIFSSRLRRPRNSAWIFLLPVFLWRRLSLTYYLYHTEEDEKIQLLYENASSIKIATEPHPRRWKCAIL